MFNIHTEFSNAPLWQKVLLICLLTFLVSYFVIQIVLSGLWQDYRVARKESLDLNQAILDAEFLIKDLPILQEKERTIKAILAEKIPRFNVNMDPIIRKVLNKSGLTITSMRSQPRQAHPYFYTQTYDMQFAGTIVECARMIQIVKNDPQTFTTNTFEFRTQPNGKSTIDTTVVYYVLNTTPPRSVGTRALTDTMQLPTLRGFWTQNGVIKVFLDSALVAVGMTYRGYTLITADEATGTAVIKDIKSNRKYTLKVLK